MSSPTVRLPERQYMVGSLALAVGFGALGFFAGGGPQALGLPAPRPELIGLAPAAVQIHLAAAVTSFAVGAILLLGPKGTLPHRTLGWIWAATMGLTAVSSLFIREINSGGLSLIHAISGWVIVALPAALYAARRHKVQAHRAAMTGLYFGGMFIAGGLAFLPGRLLGQVFLGAG
jgi:uncharacterized membrane protein